MPIPSGPDLGFDSDEIQRLWDQYRAAAHALQSGVAAMMNFDPKPTEPKHLRTGINIALCDHAALARLLINKGVITPEEYIQAILTGVRDEVTRYEQSLSEHAHGSKIKLV